MKKEEQPEDWYGFGAGTLWSAIFVWGDVVPTLQFIVKINIPSELGLLLENH